MNARLDRTQLVRHSRTEPTQGGKEETVIEVHTDPRGRGVFQWKLYGEWREEILAPVEDTLLELTGGHPFSNFWRLHDGTWGNTVWYVAMRYTWEHGPYIQGNTVQELIDGLRHYYRLEI